jgi:hypothetical protein
MGVISNTTKFVLSDQDIDDIMVTALEGGITYWCGKAEVVGKYLGEYASDQISRGGELKLYDAESDDTWILNKEKFINGVKMALDNGQIYLTDNRVDTSYIDSNVADTIIQYALFNEFVFG